MEPYGIVSDLHANNWSSFSSVDSFGRNSRLMNTVNEIDRCCQETLKAGGMTVFIAGDLFHVRGSVAPSVFNPIKEVLTKWVNKGVFFRGISGNHDLETKESTELGSSIKMLESGVDIKFIHSIGFSSGVVMAPWVSNPTSYIKSIEEYAAQLKADREDISKFDLICHIGIDGTLTGLPAHGITAERLANIGFKRVFSGHYHNHVDFGNGVYSIGATTHQTWGDVNTKAGFLIVSEDNVRFFASHAPFFIELTGEEDLNDLPLIVDGHFIQAKINDASPLEIVNWRKALLDMNAKGVIITQIRNKAAVSRVGTAVKSMSSLDKSITTYCDEKKLRPNVAAMALDVLQKARTLT